MRRRQFLASGTALLSAALAGCGHPPVFLDIFEDDDAFRSVVGRLRDHEAIEVDDFYGTWLVAYEGVDYLTYAEW